MTTNNLRRGAAIAAALLFIAALTLLPAAGEPPPPSACIVCGLRGLADDILNVGLFAPLGIALAYAGLGLLRAIPLGLAFSAAIEIAQIWIPGRYSSLGDIVTNTLGTAAGVLAWQLTPPALVLLRRRMALLALLVPPLTLLGLALGAALLRPALPAGAWNAVWRAEPAHPRWLDAPVTLARLGQLPLRRQWLREGDAVRALWLGGAPLTVVALPAGDTAAEAALFALYDPGQHELLAVGVAGPDAVLRFRTLAAVLRLDQPELRLPGGAAALRGWGVGRVERSIMASAGGHGLAEWIVAAATPRPRAPAPGTVQAPPPTSGPPGATAQTPIPAAQRSPAPPTAGASRPVAVRAWKAGPGYCFSVAGRGACGLGWGVGRSWAVLLYPGGLSPAAEDVLDMLWLCLLFLPSGLLLRRRSAVVAFGSLVLALGFVPWAAGLLPSTALAWLGAGTGLAAGYALRRAWAERPGRRAVPAHPIGAAA